MLSASGAQGFADVANGNRHRHGAVEHAIKHCLEHSLHHKIQLMQTAPNANQLSSAYLLLQERCDAAHAPGHDVCTVSRNTHYDLPPRWIQHVQEPREHVENVLARVSIVEREGKEVEVVQHTGVDKAGLNVKKRLPIHSCSVES